MICRIAEGNVIDIILEETWKTIRDYWQTAGVVIAFGVASVVMLVVDDNAQKLRGLGSTLLIAFVAMAILAVAFLAVRVIRRMNE
jgi:hypothetical protein